MCALNVTRDPYGFVVAWVNYPKASPAEGAFCAAPMGATMGLRALEIEVSLTAGATATTQVAFPARALAFGVTGRVVSEVTGTATSWALGVPDEPARYGTGIGTSLNAWVNGPGTPQVTWAPTPLLITAEGGDFAGGTIRLVSHYAELSLPDLV